MKNILSFEILRYLWCAVVKTPFPTVKYEAKYSRADQVKFVKDRPYNFKIFKAIHFSILFLIQDGSF